MGDDLTIEFSDALARWQDALDQWAQNAVELLRPLMSIAETLNEIADEDRMLELRQNAIDGGAWQSDIDELVDYIVMNPGWMGHTIYPGEAWRFKSNHDWIVGRE